MPEGVVDVLEPVEVQEQQGSEGSVAFGARQRKLETVAKQGSIRQPGQGVVRRLVSQLLPRADSLNRAPKVPAYLSHHLEQAGIGGDRRCGEELQNRAQLAIRVDWEGKGSANSEVLSREARVVGHIGDPCRIARGEHAARKANPLGEGHLLGHAAKGREPIRLLDVPARHRHQVR